MNNSSLEEKQVFVSIPEQSTNPQPGLSCNSRPIRAAKAKGIVINFTMGENEQPRPSIETRTKKKRILQVFKMIIR